MSALPASTAPAPVTVTAPTGAPAAGADPAATPATPAAPAAPAQSKLFAVNARKEQQLQRDREALKSGRAELATREAAIKELETKYGSKPKTALEALERYGFSYGDATQTTLNDGQLTAEQIAKQAVDRADALAKQIEDDKKAAADLKAADLKAAQEAAVAQFKENINGFLAAKPDDYEFIALYDQQELVFDTINDHYQNTGKILELKEAADLVEAFVEEQASKILEAKKFKAKGQPQPESGNPASREAPGQVSAQRRTLSNELHASTPTLAKSSTLGDERTTRALAALNGQPVPAKR